MQEIGYTGFLIGILKGPRDKDSNALSLAGRWSQKLKSREVRYTGKRRKPTQRFRYQAYSQCGTSAQSCREPWEPVQNSLRIFTYQHSFRAAAASGNINPPACSKHRLSVLRWPEPDSASKSQVFQEIAFGL